MFIKISGPLPTKAEITRISVPQIVASHEFPRHVPDDGLNADTYQKLKSKWLALKGPVKDTEHFAVAVSDDPNDPWLAVVEYDHGRIFVGVKHTNELPINLFETLAPPTIRKAETCPGPNDRCPCKSGKKYKRCCQNR